MKSRKKTKLPSKTQVLKILRELGFDPRQDFGWKTVYENTSKEYCLDRARLLLASKTNKKEIEQSIQLLVLYLSRTENE